MRSGLRSLQPREGDRDFLRKATLLDGSALTSASFLRLTPCFSPYALVRQQTGWTPSLQTSSSSPRNNNPPPPRTRTSTSLHPPPRPRLRPRPPPPGPTQQTTPASSSETRTGVSRTLRPRHTTSTEPSLAQRTTSTALLGRAASRWTVASSSERLVSRPQIRLSLVCRASERLGALLRRPVPALHRHNGKADLAASVFLVLSVPFDARPARPDSTLARLPAFIVSSGLLLQPHASRRLLVNEDRLSE